MSAYLYTPDDDSECPMDYQTSLLPNIFPNMGIKLNLFRLWAEYHDTYNRKEQ